MTWDLIYIGEDWKLIWGFQYISIFIVKRSRYAITNLHKDRSDFVGILQRAIAKAGFRSSAFVVMVPESMSVVLWPSFWIQRFSNGTSETFVDSIGKGICTLLLQSHLPPEFWSAAAHYWTDVYNHIPHSSISDQIPYTMHHGAKPD
eukprot:3530119-Rhodomonas_salina.1